ncbi:mitochondrial translation release factor in rescue [Battus philenor]|uniref:mitochondrial translation release factor in rescue n=1 Tax=Battus philenor TaxID=42288 RepID=UPI0035D11B8C
MFILKLPNVYKIRPAWISNCLIALKHIDYSLVPKINESELEEQFVRGGGPGGSAVNKNANCVVLTHNPTGTVVKCHLSRCQDENRKLAREMLVAKLDEVMNGANSVAAQKKRLREEKLKKNEYKRKKIAHMKEEWKKREGLS